jgi:hypothetical protein
MWRVSRETLEGLKCVARWGYRLVEDVAFGEVHQ